MSPPLPQGVPSRAHDIIVTGITCCILTTLFLGLRMYMRIAINRVTGWDDYVALATYPFVITYSVLTGVATRYGMGLHVADMHGDVPEQFQKWIFIGSFTWLISLLGYKMSIMLLYLRIFNVNRPFRYCVWAVMFLTFSYLFANFWTQLFGCHPIRKAWMKKIPGHCIAAVDSDYAYGSLNWISDVLIFLLPLPMVWGLKLGRKEKIAISITFMLGALNWIVAIVRWVYVLQDLTAPDRPWIAAITFLWSIIEVNSGLMLACLPVLKPIFFRIVPKVLSEKSWSFGKTKDSWNGETLKGDTQYSHKSYIELEHGKVRSEKTSVSTAAGSPHWPSHEPFRTTETKRQSDGLDEAFDVPI